MIEIIKLIAEGLAAQGKIVRFKPNSVFAGLELSPGLENRNQIAEKVATMVSNEISLIRNKFIPFSKEYIELIEKSLAETQSVSDLKQYKIIEKKIPELLSKLMDNGKVTKLSDSIELPVGNLSIPFPEAVSEIKLENSVEDKLLKSILNKYTEDELKEIWDRYLGNISGSNDNISRLSFRAVEDMDLVLVIYAMINSVKDTRPKGVRINESKYVEIMSYFNAYVVNALNNSAEKFMLFEKYDKLVIGYEGKELIVCEKVYDKYLENNPMEALLGMLYSGKAERGLTLEHVISEKDTYLESWNNAVKLDEVKTATREINRYKAVYSIALTELMKEVPSDVAKYVEINESNAHELVNIFLNGSSEKVILDINNTAISIISEIVFTNTNMKRFISYMKNYSNANSKLKPEDAATMSGIDFIIDYYLEQIDIEN